ncbi:hypothetical protein KC799_22005 [candidate division KSB1 bacterium]|nr:hypothetical protein [candidate division KSB1 bacterium]
MKDKPTHDAHAPYWAAGFVLLCGTGLSTIWIDSSAFWHGYVLDITGPAWNYILFRGLYTTKAENRWTKFFTARKTLLIFLFVCFTIEGMQYFNFYASTYDPWDFLAYIALLIPLYILDEHIGF